MPQMTHTRSYAVLKELAAHPIDLTDPQLMTPERVMTYQLSKCGITCAYACERVDKAVLSALRDLAKESDAVKKMQAIQSGEVMNRIIGYPSENRQVLHTAMRDFFGHRHQQKAAKQAADEAYLEVEKLERFVEKIDQQPYDTIVQIGIGGSDLGPQAIYLALKAYQQKKRQVYFVSNVDPDDAVATLAKIDLKKTLIIIVSKSGTTVETLTNEEFFRQAYAAQGLDSKKHFIAVTQRGSPMDNPERYLASFYIWDFVGGRYSVTSMVGGVVLSLGLGFEVYQQFIEGACEMDKVALEEDLQENLPLLGALLGIWNRNFLNHPTLAIIPYSQAMSRFTAHLQQLEMESNGKRVTIEGARCDFSTSPVIWGEIGTNGQHSFYQMIHQGTDVVPVTFIGFTHQQLGVDWTVEGTTSQQKLNANLLAQAMALAIGKYDANPNRHFPGNRPSHLLMAKQLDPYILGALLSYFEHKVAFQGLIWGINSFDQEGVQLGKVQAGEFLRLMRSVNLSAQDQPLIQAFLKLL